MHPSTQYTKSGDLWIAYQVFGDGPFDLVFAPGWMSHVEQNWEWPVYERFLRRLASFSRVMIFDRRGTGLSDRVGALVTYEEMMDDVRAVMDAVGSDRAALLGSVEGGPMCALFAATHPERTSALVLASTFAKRTRAPDYPWAPAPEDHDRVLEAYEARYGRSSLGLNSIAPGMARDASFRAFVTKAQRYGASPGAAIAWYRMTTDIDIRHVLPSIRVPTLIVHQVADAVADIGGARWMAEQIPGAKLVELAGINHFFMAADADADAVAGEVEQFLTGSRTETEADRVLATVLFTDIVGSTERAAALGDRRWRDLLDAHDRAFRVELERHRGREVKATGDGLLATFDGPARAIRCALAMIAVARTLGVDIRAGLHTGECEARGEDVGGLAVHIAARVVGLAGTAEVLVSSTVKDLVIGSSIQFADRGTHALKGVPGEWHLYAVNE